MIQLLFISFICCFTTNFLLAATNTETKSYAQAGAQTRTEVEKGKEKKKEKGKEKEREKGKEQKKGPNTPAAKSEVSEVSGGAASPLQRFPFVEGLERV